MTNRELWHLYCRDLFTNRINVEWGWHMLVAAALERRVFYDNPDHPQYANMYTVFLAPAGVGKGLVLDEIRKMLSHHKYPAKTSSHVANYNIPNSATKALNRYEKGFGALDLGEETMFQLAADSTTFESLLVEMVSALKTQEVKHYETGEIVTIAHGSLTFVLDEFTSVFKEHASDLITFLLTSWNCKPYTRKTKRSGHDDLKNICLNLTGGTTPSEFAKLLRKDIVGTGILSRIMLVYTDRNDKSGIRIPAYTPEQLEARAKLQDWLLKLKSAYYCVRYEDGVEAYLESWFRSGDYIVNRNARLDEYYARKINHLHKLVMAHHFGEPGFERKVPLSTIKYVIDMMAANEQNMHLAFSTGGRNELASVQRYVVNYLRKHPMGCTMNDLVTQFNTDCSVSELNDILAAAQMAHLIVVRNEPIPGTNHNVTKYIAI